MFDEFDDTTTTLDLTTTTPVVEITTTTTPPMESNRTTMATINDTTPIITGMDYNLTITTIMTDQVFLTSGSETKHVNLNLIFHLCYVLYFFLKR